MRKITIALVLMALTMCMAVPTFADIEKKVDGSDLIVSDKADLFTDSEESKLASEMTSLCEYGDVIVATLSDNNYTTEYASDMLLRKYGNDGVIFMIDMDNREIYMFTTYDELTAGKCYSITDNVYKYASDGEYYECASEAIVQAGTVMSGRRIAQPMKYIDNALLAIIIAMIICFIWMMRSAKKRKVSEFEMAVKATSDLKISNQNLRVTGVRKIKHESSVGSGGGGGHGGGGGGGGHGGGHSF